MTITMTRTMSRENDMDARNMSRMSGPKFAGRLALLASAAMMTASFTACTTAAAPRAEVSYNKAQKALTKGKTSRAIEHAEAAVLAEPRNPQYRALLGKVYLEAGRYQSAATSLRDALELGSEDPRTVLSYALTQTAIGGGKNALDTLREYERVMDPADAGLAMALAGDPERGVFVLTNALRAGQNTPKLRQNLAYTYALAGNWRAARVMAAEDVPADQLDARLSDWASNARPEGQMARVSQLLGIAPVEDGGMPTMLALSNFPSAAQMAAEAEATANTMPAQFAAAPEADKSPIAAKPVESPPTTAPKPGVTRIAEAQMAKPDGQKVEAIKAQTGAPAAPARVAAKTSPNEESGRATRTVRRSSKTVQPSKPAGPAFVSRPVTQDLPAPTSKAPAPQRVAAAQKKAPSAKPAPKPAAKGDSHMVQLGSYNSEAEAKAGWTTLQRKFADLKWHDVVITKAEVKGKTFYRVAAAGFGRQGAVQMCSTVRSSGGGCFAYAKINPPAGAVDKGTRIAAASR
jgi:tetratricopeptide (TPR) repeat protein